ncbi:multicomponent Na+:H+ antiporter subunit G [Skermanella aerolata]|jgi:multicomponent Na+:H+ antiporter subunit G|uniref:Na+/H+ antiporter subunit G n=1 Tax=Skermanella aerolata TaxID=393310 RepID=A0A512E0D2_9PROT|nr:monovalent cation/H(+) antiporter subunit G [Skermanella aerolata]KJB91990.1 sodium:proton antiporter [Skermanella aerolata KACC 11604]GEO41910.1 Na+/H+ antiporter subunit G [Skermanella aerolata]
MIGTILEILAGVLLVGGGVFSLISALGVLRLPDVLIRMHASSKAGTVGAGMILLAVAVLYGGGEIVARAIAAIFFLLLTVPVASHMIGRAAYVTGVKLWSGTVIDELRERYEVPKRKEDEARER